MLRTTLFYAEARIPGGQGTCITFKSRGTHRHILPASKQKLLLRFGSQKDIHSQHHSSQENRVCPAILDANVDRWQHPV